MSDTNWTQREILDAWLAVCSGDATQEQCQRLSRLIVEDPELRQRLIALGHHQAYMVWHGASLAADDDSDDAGERIAARLSESFDADDQADRTPVCIPCGLPAIDGPAEVFVVGAGPAPVAAPAWRQLGWVPLLTFVVGVLVAGYVSPLLRPKPAVVATAPGAAPITPAAHLTLATGCSWGDADAASWSIGHGVRTGDEINLLEGLAEFRLASGAEFTIEGPAALVVTSPSSLLLQYGKLTARVDGDGACRLSANTCSVTAYKAEFGVRVAGGDVDVHVFAGHVIAGMSPFEDGAQLMPASDIVEAPPIVVGAGRALAIVNRGSNSRIDRWHRAEPSEFATKLPMAGALPISIDYVDLVKQSDPVAYWRFEGTDELNVIPNEMGGDYGLQAVGEIRWSGDDKNRVAELGALGPDGHLISVVPVEELVGDCYTVEAWVKPSHVHWGSLVSMILDPGVSPREEHTFLLELEPGYRSDERFVARVRYLHRNDPSNFSGGTDCLSAPAYSVRRWQHVAAVKDGPQLRLYIDGQLAGEHLDDTPLNGQPPYVVVGQLYSNYRARVFVGQFDELAIYDRALTAEEVASRPAAVNWRPQRPAEPRRQASRDGRGPAI